MDINDKLIGLLENETIFSKQNALDLRAYIRKKYPNFSSTKNAMIFADAIHKILDKNLSPFSNERRLLLKKQLFHQCVDKQSYSISGKDIFLACLHLSSGKEDFLQEFQHFYEDILCKKLFLLTRSGGDSSNNSANATKEFMDPGSNLENLPAEENFIALQDDRTADPSLFLQVQQTEEFTVLAHEQQAEETTIHAHEQQTEETIIYAHDQQAEEATIYAHEQQAEETTIHAHEQQTEETTIYAHEQHAEETTIHAYGQQTEETTIHAHEQQAEEATVSAYKQPPVLFAYTNFFDFCSRIKLLTPPLRKWLDNLKNLQILKNNPLLRYSRLTFPLMTALFILPVSYHSINHVSLAIPDTEKLKLSSIPLKCRQPKDIVTSVGKMAEQQKNQRGSTEESESPSLNQKNYGTKGKRLDLLATAYDLSMESSGRSPDDPQYGFTALGTKATKRKTISVNPAVIPLGSRIQLTFPLKYSKFNGVYVAEDVSRFGERNMIDIFWGEDIPGERIVFEEAREFRIQKVIALVLD